MARVMHTEKYASGDFVTHKVDAYVAKPTAPGHAGFGAGRCWGGR